MPFRGRKLLVQFRAGRGVLMSETQLVLKGYGARHAPDNSISVCEAVSGRKIAKIAKPDCGR